MRKTRKETNVSIRKIRFQELGDDIFSQSDASEHREEGVHAGI